MTNKQPTVSVVMATYNGEKYIREQIDSILNQSYSIYELIIQDDCSTDSTPSICREYEAKHPNVHFYQNEHNLGFNENFRTAALRSTGDLVALSDQDDVWFPQKIEKQVAAIGEHDICASWITRGTEMKSARIVRYSDKPLEHLYHLPLGHTMVMKKEFAQEENNWKSGFRFFDWNLTMNADINNGIIVIEKPLNWHRWHATSSSCSMEINGLKKHNPTSTNRLEPYMKGFQRYHEIQKRKSFIHFYEWVFNHTNEKMILRDMHFMAGLMLKRGWLSTFRLCVSCFKNRHIILDPNKSNGLGGMIKGFFHPAIYFYWTDFFD